MSWRRSCPGSMRCCSGCPRACSRAELYFTPAGLDLGGAEALSVEPAWPEDHIMVRGPYAPEHTGLPFILPALAHC